MKNETEKALQLIKESEQLVFMTGAGVSVPSGIPDYRSLDGVYSGIDQPEYLLSHTCLDKEPDKFYQFTKLLYHPQAQPNVIHRKMAELEKVKKDCTVITQNIDQLHDKAGSQNVLHFHGSLYDVYCRNCRQEVSAEDYLKSDRHEGCGGQLRPNVVLYEEMLDETIIAQSVEKILGADTIVIVGTSLRVYPFAGLIQYKNSNSHVILVNKEAVLMTGNDVQVLGDAADFFEKVVIE
ncbi:NAD-dependent protein deacylase [Vagococcus elongatus]|uniref:protein acetyllysine N-acetyltransferase n=1 Tax=Vagococcus elongatus TaxID=180344 RepID=A0A430APY3_9ENTE|nr:NAD-dependent protein deacylase [Vagococcus elongatus]RSU09984.1 NAD-dependent protein deacylase [Vagococcus elongatus]